MNVAACGCADSDPGEISRKRLWDIDWDFILQKIIEIVQFKGPTLLNTDGEGF